MAVFTEISSASDRWAPKGAPRAESVRPRWATAAARVSWLVAGALLVAATAAAADEWNSGNATPMDPISTDGRSTGSSPPPTWRDSGVTTPSISVRRPSRARDADRPKTIYEIVLPAMNAPERVTQDAYANPWARPDAPPASPVVKRRSHATAPSAPAPPPATAPAAPHPTPRAAAESETASGAPTERPSSGPGGAAPTATLEYDDHYAAIEQIWAEHRSGILTANLDAAGAATTHMRAVMTRAGIRSLPAFAMVFLRTASREAAAGNLPAARELAAMATDLAPTTPETWLALARYRIGGPNEDLSLALSSLKMAFRAAIESSAHLAAFAGNLLTALLAALIAVIAALLLAPATRALLIYNEIAAERLPRSISSSVRILLIGALFVAPLVAPGGIGWFLLATLLASCPFMERRERAAFVLVALVLAAAGPITRLRASFDVYPSSAGLQAVAESDAGILTKSGLDRVERALADPGDRGPLLSAKAHLLKLVGDLVAANEVYESARALMPDDASTANNHGNVLAALGRPEAAEAAYGEAARLAPKDAVIQFNLGQIYGRLGRIPESEAALRLARSLDPDLVGMSGGPQPAIDRRGEAGRWWRALVAARPIRDAAAEALWQRLFPWMPLGFAPALAALAAFALIAPVVLKKERLLRICDRCGALMRGSADGSVGEEATTCASCRALAAQATQLAPELRSRQLARIERFQALKRRALGLAPLAIPGLGHLLRGRFVRGVAVLGAFFGIAALWWNAAGRYRFSPVYAPLEGSMIAVVATTVALAAIYFAGLPRRKGR